MRCLLGHIDHKELHLNDAGKMIERWYYELENKFPDIRCHEQIIMPNHFHCIIENTGIVLEDLRVFPSTEKEAFSSSEKQAFATSELPPLLSSDKMNLDPNSPNQDSIQLNQSQLDATNTHNNSLGENKRIDILGSHKPPDILGEHRGSPLSGVVQRFKTMTTNEYIRGVKNLGWKPFDGKLWQRNYYEHIIRDDHAYENISNYIISNPSKWKGDKFYER
ncbi:MAG TPA: transposase [Cytophagaceae bacterium]|jgi:hypothetical protein